MRYTLRQLQVFVAAAHYENISKAADSLAMSQSAASTALKEVERQFDIQLFDRVGKRMRLNSLGKALRAQAERLLAEADEFEKALGQHKAVTLVRLGATLTIGSYLAIDLMSGFESIRENSEISLSVANTQHIIDQLLNFEIDLALVEGEVNHPDLIVEPWREDELCVFASPDNPYSRFSSLKDKALVEASWILREKGSGTRQAFEHAMTGIYPEMLIKHELEHAEAIKKAVRANMGISCLSKLTVQQELDAGVLVQLKPEQRNLTRKFYMVRHKDKFISEGLAIFIQYCRQFEDI